LQFEREERRVLSLVNPVKHRTTLADQYRRFIPVQVTKSLNRPSSTHYGYTLLTLWRSCREVRGSHPGHATILLGSNLGQVVYKLPPQSSHLQESGGTKGSIQTGQI